MPLIKAFFPCDFFLEINKMLFIFIISQKCQFFKNYSNYCKPDITKVIYNMIL